MQRADRLVEVDGRRLNVVVAGEGSPTVVLEAGGGCSSDEWTAIQHRVAKVTSTISYDRAGEGRSDPGKPWDVVRWVTDLNQLLGTTHVQPPYILVGHSIGCLVLRMFATYYPDRIAGAVLIDGQPEQLYDRMPELATIARAANPDGTFDRILDACEWVKANVTALTCPTTVITHSRTDMIATNASITQHDVERFEHTWRSLQHEVTKHAKHARIVVADSGHMIPVETPDLVTEEILRMLSSERKRIQQRRTSSLRISTRQILEEDS